MVLGDYLSAEQREEFIRARFVSGRIVRLTLNLTFGPKIKYFLIAHVGVETLGLIINTSVNDFKQGRPELLECQVPIDQAGHPGLDHDSFVDCSQAHYEDTAELKAQLMADVGGIRDELSEVVRLNILAALNDSFVLEKNEKQRLIEVLTR